jgi:hypothetical protein
MIAIAGPDEDLHPAQIESTVVPMKFIARVLQVTGFIATFLAASYAMNHTIDLGSCRRLIIGPFGGLIPIVMMALAFGFGAVARNELSGRLQLWLWAFAALYFGVHSQVLIVHEYGSDEKKWRSVADVFIPDFRPGYAHETLAPLFSDVARYWMPSAAGLSAVAFAITLTSTVRNCDRAGQDAGVA